MDLSESNIIRTLKRHKPQTAEELLACELPLQRVSWGQFRVVYEVIGTNLVIKLPLPGYKGRPLLTNIRHAVAEYRAYKAVLRSKRKYVRLQPFLPRIHYFSFQSGVTLVEKYTPLEGHHCPKRYEFLAQQVFDDICEVTGVEFHDIDSGCNMGLDRYGNLKMLDLGYLLGP